MENLGFHLFLCQFLCLVNISKKTTLKILSSGFFWVIFWVNSTQLTRMSTFCGGKLAPFLSKPPFEKYDTNLRRFYFDT
jgi:hypothetical protein